MFNPNPRVQTLAIGGRALCHVIDDALREPERWVEYAGAHDAEFVEAPYNAYPGPELRLPEAVTAQLDGFFHAHLGAAFAAQRTLRGYSRLALTTRAPAELTPAQRVCHVDRLGMEPGQGIAACVLYLFRDEAFGGTGFYRPLRPLPDIARLMQDASALDDAEFSARHGIAPGYMTAANGYFAKLLSVPARWNRLVFYSGTVFHSGDITAPERLARDPRRGRLTLNGFFQYQRAPA
jgi:hypothetical protein